MPISDTPKLHLWDPRKFIGKSRGDSADHLGDECIFLHILGQSFGRMCYSCYLRLWFRIKFDFRWESIRAKVRPGCSFALQLISWRSEGAAERGVTGWPNGWRMWQIFTILIHCEILGVANHPRKRHALPAKIIENHVDLGGVLWKKLSPMLENTISTKLGPHVQPVGHDLRLSFTIVTCVGTLTHCNSWRLGLSWRSTIYWLMLTPD